MYLLLRVAILIAAIELACGQNGCEGRSCFPNTGDLLVGRGHMLSATSTCGQNGPSPYCIVSHLQDIQKCFTCDAQQPDKSHAVQNVITTFNDRLETWWQSENGKQQVSIQLDLEAEFQFTHMIMTFKTFRPAAMFIERSMDFGKTWQMYRYFAYDCDKSFPGVAEWPPIEIDDVICDSRYSLIEPSNGGEVIYRVLEPFIKIEDPYTPRIQNLLKITNLRFNFTELHTLGDDLLDARSDIKSKYYYSLYELIVRGNCFCYGHADECTPIQVGQPNSEVHDVMVHGRCQCQHNTVGLNCEQCLPFYQDQPWRPAETGMAHECQPCNCNNHATECHFDPAVYAATGQVSGGVCENCQHNTVGRSCEQCAPYYFQDPQKDIRDPTVCAACDCDVSGSLDGGICDPQTNSDLGMIAGQCRCKRNVEGPRCDRCKAGYYGLDENNPDGCTACDCDSLGTLSGANTCNAETGQCICKRFTTGRRCDMCVPQTWGMSSVPHGCTECDCDVGGAYNNDCEERTGQCPCRPNINNRRCDVVISGNYLPGLDHYIFEAEDAQVQQGAYEDKRSRDVPPVTWTGDGYMLVQEEGVIVFIVSGLPASMDYNLILRYQSNEPNAWNYVDITIDRPNQGNIPTSSPCGNTRPEDDNWVTSLPGPPTTHHSLGIICLENDYTYRVIVDMRRYQREPNPEGAPRADILIDSLVVVPVHTNMDMFHGTVAGVERARQFEDLDCVDEEMDVPDRRPGEECLGLMFSMSSILHDGALPCDCDQQGSESSICDEWSGTCRCKRNVIGRRCDRCAPGTYGFGPNGCRPCDCDVRGSRDKFCDVTRGQCTCLPGVSGRRCDQCMPGHFRFPDCERCQCNGHADTCDQQTGACIQCRDNTMGDQCDSCISGYYGNPFLGSVDQCKPCMCPNGPNSGRQFASGCRYDALSGQVTCYCLPGYDGPRCDECAPAYWGNPQDSNGMCRECECNGNVDPLDPGACDASTGVCTGCLYDTAGPHCEQCRDFYYGSAFDNTCTACACNLLGTERSYCVDDQCQCDTTTGQCPCLPNVAGRNCGQCEPNHWRLASGVGCERCDCNLANSNGPTCDEFTGQCQCVEGFGGRTCNDCADGHFGDPNSQCYGFTTTKASAPEIPSTTTTTAAAPNSSPVTSLKSTTTECDARGDAGCDIFPNQATTSSSYPTSTQSNVRVTTTKNMQSSGSTLKTTALQPPTSPGPEISTHATTRNPLPACDCNLAGSVSAQCHTRNGQCECKVGVGGRKCDRCLRGFTGEVPDCQPCGECFDNWDAIITQLKERTTRAIERARRIGETGISGAFDTEFDYIEDMLNDFESPLNDPSGQNDIDSMVEMITNKLNEQEDRLNKLEAEMDRIRMSDEEVGSNMTELDAKEQLLNDKLDSLRSQKQNISKVSPVAAFKQVQDAAEASAKAERDAQAATTDPGSLVEQSQQIREEVQQDIDDKKMEFDDKLVQVEADLAVRKREVDELTISDLNADVCGKPTEECDEKCGGAGCQTCGGIGCNGAVQFANDAKDRAQKTQARLTQVAEETGDLRLRVKAAKENAQEAKQAAQAAKDRAQEVEANIKSQNSEVRDLIQDIRDFLNSERSQPQNIEMVANQVLALSLPISRSEIDALAASIRDLVNGLPDVDDILVRTQDDMDRANKLLEDARQANADASAVANDIKTVVNALEAANNATDKANDAKNQAMTDIQLAEDKIDEIKSATTDIENTMTEISRTLNDYDKRLTDVERKLTENNLRLTSAKQEADMARDDAQSAMDSLDGQETLINEATAAINDKKDKTDRLTALKNNARSLANEVADSQQRLDDVQQRFINYERQLNRKNEDLRDLLAEAKALHVEISDSEEFLRTCT